MTSAEYWLDTWQDNKNLFFHLPEVHPLLIKYYADFKTLNENSVFFVPLAGKSLDITWLSKKHSVIAVEISELAIVQFFKEQGLTYSIEKHAFGECYSSGNIQFYRANLFDLPQTVLAPITHIYDRASLVALAEPTRSQYLRFCSENIPSLREWLIIFMSFNEQGYQGPPFSIESRWLDDNLMPRYAMATLRSDPVTLEQDSHLYQKGLREMTHKVALLTQLSNT